MGCTQPSGPSPAHRLQPLQRRSYIIDIGRFFHYTRFSICSGIARSSLTIDDFSLRFYYQFKLAPFPHRPVQRLHLTVRKQQGCNGLLSYLGPVRPGPRKPQQGGRQRWGHHSRENRVTTTSSLSGLLIALHPHFPPRGRLPLPSGSLRGGVAPCCPPTTQQQVFSLHPTFPISHSIHIGSTCVPNGLPA